MKKQHLDAGAGVNSYIAEIAARMHGRLAEVSSTLRRSLEDQIPELRSAAALLELLGGGLDTPEAHAALASLLAGSTESTLPFGQALDA